MPNHPAIPGLRDALKEKVTLREKFLLEMDEVVTWVRLVALIEPHYLECGPKGGRPPMPPEMMLRIYFLQSHYALSDPMTEDSLHAPKTMHDELTEEFRRRVKTQTVLPCTKTVPMLLWVLMASGQIQMRKVEGWKTLSQPNERINLDLAA